MDTRLTKGSEWLMAFAMPNLLLRETFEFGDIALVGACDARFQQIVESNPAAAALHAGFVHCLPTGARPSAAILRSDHRFKDPWQALVDARNIVAVLACCQGWVRNIGLLNHFFYRATEHFDFYPYRPRDDGKYLLCTNSETNRLTSRLEKFKGGVHPWLFIHPNHRIAVDEALLLSLQSVWLRVHTQAATDHSDRRIMRSLAVAYEACRKPLQMESFLHDHGRHCSLWVSAFETLAHPGPPHKVGISQVLDLIGQRTLYGDEWNDRETYEIGQRKLRRVYSLNVAQQLYRDLYKARNDFLHGNELEIETFVPRGLGAEIRLLDTAPLVYHAAVEAHVFSGESGNDVTRWTGLEDGFGRAFRTQSDDLGDLG